MHPLKKVSKLLFFQARQVKRCTNQKDECLSFEILRKEANATSIEKPRLYIKIQSKSQITND